MTAVYQFTMYDILTDTERESRRWGTREAIDRIGGKVIEDSAVNIDTSLLGSEVEGMTDVGLIPAGQAALKNRSGKKNGPPSPAGRVLMPRVS